MPNAKGININIRYKQRVITKQILLILISFLILNKDTNNKGK